MMTRATQAHAASSSQPVTLSVADRGGMVEILVKGLSRTAFDASYSVHVQSDAPGSSTRSTQGGTVHLHPGREATLVALAFTTQPAAAWSVVLDVTPVHGAPYRVRRDLGGN